MIVFKPCRSGRHRLQGKELKTKRECRKILFGIEIPEVKKLPMEGLKNEKEFGKRIEFGRNS